MGVQLIGEEVSKVTESEGVGTAEEEMELPGMLNRCVKLITGVKKIVAEMRATNKNVISHREKCSMILSAAMATSVALDQVPP